MKGVYWHKAKQAWLAQPIINGERLYIGYYKEKNYAEQVVWNAIQRAEPLIKPGIRVDPVTQSRARWDSVIKKWTKDGMPCKDQKKAGREHRRSVRRNKFPVRKRSALLKPKPGPLTEVDRDNPYRRKKEHTNVTERYSMTPGVTYMKIAKRWVGWAKVDGKRTYLGTFDSEELAAEAVNKAKGV